MRKTTLILCWSIITSASAQTNIFPANGNVGIGIINPVTLLDVATSTVGAIPASGIARIGNYDYTGQTNKQVLSLAPGIFGIDKPEISNGAFIVNEKFNVGISTINPQGKLHISNTDNSGVDNIFAINDGNDRPAAIIRGNYPEIDLISNASNTRHGSTIRFASYDNSSKNTWKQWVVGIAGQNASYLDFGYSQNDANPHSGIDNYAGGSGAGITFLRINNNGNVGIGTTSPTEKLSVNGNIRSKKLIVTQNGWSDYVFDSSYQLKSLTEIEQFVKANKHLPDVPSASEVAKNGIDVGDNQVLLLKKIEELTLYMIKQQKQIDELRVKNEKLEKEVESLK